MMEIFSFTRERRMMEEEEEVCPNSKGFSVAKRSPNFLMLA
jgi:hypothetical protein